MRAFIGLASLVLLANTAFAQTKIPAISTQGFTTISEALTGKNIRKGSGTSKPAEGDVMKLYLSYYLHRPGAKEDSLYFTSARNPKDKFIAVTMGKPLYTGDVFYGLYQMHAGDSAHFLVKADSFLLKSAGFRNLPENHKAGDQILFCAGVKEIVPKAVVEENQRKEMERRQAEANEKASAEKALIDAYLKQQNITVAPQASGLYYVPVSQGNGGLKPGKGQKVTVHYTGYLLNGNKFDSSVDRGQPFQFELGKGQVIAGWDEGIALMAPGDKAKLIIPSNLGYGSRSMGSIPAFSTLVFEVELLKVE